MRYDRPALLRRRLVGKLDTMPHEGIFMFGRQTPRRRSGLLPQSAVKSRKVHYMIDEKIVPVLKEKAPWPIDEVPLAKMSISDLWWATV
jgi:hypothetical protein